MALVKAGFEVQGLDLNAVWLEKYAPGWAKRLRITHTNIEQDPLPFPSDSFDLVIFTESWSTSPSPDPCVVLGEIRRVLRPGGRMLLSTPNVANLSNVVALIQGENVFWPPEIFYGSVDRHNREYTPAELLRLIERAGFAQHALGYMNTWSNWNHTTAPLFHRLLDGSERAQRIGRHPLFNNTSSWWPRDDNPPSTINSQHLAAVRYGRRSGDAVGQARPGVSRRMGGGAHSDGSRRRHQDRRTGNRAEQREPGMALHRRYSWHTTGSVTVASSCGTASAHLCHATSEPAVERRCRFAWPHQPNRGRMR